MPPDIIPPAGLQVPWLVGSAYVGAEVALATTAHDPPYGGYWKAYFEVECPDDPVDPPWTYGAWGPYVASGATCELSFTLHTVVGTYHTHTVKTMRDEWFSPRDISEAYKYSLPAYLMTPIGAVRKYEIKHGVPEFSTLVWGENDPFRPPESRGAEINNSGIK